METSFELELPGRSTPEVPEKRCYTVEDLQNILMCGRVTVYDLLKIENVRGLGVRSMACAEQVDTIDKIRILKYLGKVNKEQLDAVAEAVAIHLGYPVPECVEAP